MSRFSSFAAVLLASLLLVVPGAQAAFQVHAGFLMDSEEAPPPIEPGVLSPLAPTDMNGTRVLLFSGAPEPLSPVWVLDNVSQYDRTLWGRGVLALWIDAAIGETPELHAELLALPPEGDPLDLATGTANISTQPPATPDPEALVPPDPTDPQGAANHLVAQALAATLKPPLVVNFTFNGTQLLPADHRLALRLTLALPDDPSATSAAILQYGGQLAPSFLYVGMREEIPKPPVTTTSKAPVTTTTSTPPGTTTPTPTPTSEPEREGAPGMPTLLVLVGLLGAAAIVASRQR